MNRAFLIGREIYLRPMEISDLDGEYLQWVNDPEVRESLHTLRFPTTRSQLMEYIERQNRDVSIIFLAVVHKKTGKHIGNVKIGPIEWVDRRAEYGRLIGDKDCRGKGIGTEMVALILEYGFLMLNLHKMSTSAMANNIASIRSNEKNGLMRSGLRKEHRYYKGQYVDVVEMGILKKDYLKSKIEKKKNK